MTTSQQPFQRRCVLLLCRRYLSFSVLLPSVVLLQIKNVFKKNEAIFSFVELYFLGCFVVVG